MKIGNLNFKKGIFLAPMLDITDLPFRILCRRNGAELAFTEMIYINSIIHENKKTKQMTKTNKEDTPIGLQITGNSEKEFEEFLKLNLEKKYDIVDLNCGCPSNKIIGSQAGSYLLKNPKKIGRIVRILKRKWKIVTVKVRLGFDKINIFEVLKEIEKNGGNAITVHLRLATDGYNKKAMWDLIPEIKKKAKIPFIANGDIFSKEDAEKVFRLGADGIIIGRGAIGNPGIFKEIKKNEKSDKISLALEYLKLEKEFNGSLKKIRKVSVKFLKGKRGASAIREKISKSKSIDEIIELFLKL